MTSERQGESRPFRRLESEEFKVRLRNGFADLLEDRATDPERRGGANETLYMLAQDVRDGKKIPPTPAALSIFRGVFFGGPLGDLHVSQFEIDALEKDFFE